MQQPVTFFNWSLKRALGTQADSFAKARIKIIYSLLIVSIIKSAVVVFLAATNDQTFQMNRAAIAFIIYAVLLKVLLSRPQKIKLLSHIMIIAGTLIVWTNIIMYTNSVNLLTVQFTFMIMLGSFYTLGSRLGFFYSALNIVPAIVLLILNGNTYFFQAQNLVTPGPEIIMVLNFVTMVFAHYLFYEAFASNLKEKEGLNQQLQASIIEANKLAESKSNFLSTMSHELRTPLNSVIGMSEILLENNRDEKQQENLEILHSSSQDLLALINNVLDFNKSDAAKTVLEATPFQLAQLVRDKCSGLLLKLRDKNLEFFLDIDPELRNTLVISDPVRLSQVIYNLVNNAIKFTEHGSITVRLDELSRNGQKSTVLFSVIDTGIGIHPDKHEAIFELFTQAEADTTRNYGGTGLGLAIVKQILTLFDSAIRLESTPGEGSAFSFAILFDIHEEPAQPKPAPVDRRDLSHLRILIAEDNELNSLILKKQMEKLNLSPVIVGNGLAAFDRHLSDNYDVLLLDLHMPVMNGYETIQKIRSMADPLKANIPIIAFTASTTEQEKIIEAGFSQSIHKPTNINDLYDKLELIAYAMSRME